MLLEHNQYAANMLLNVHFFFGIRNIQFCNGIEEVDENRQRDCGCSSQIVTNHVLFQLRHILKPW